MRSIHRTPLVVAAVGALALTACAGDAADAPDGTTTETVTTTETATVEPTATEPTGADEDAPTDDDAPAPTSTAGGVPALSSTCTLQGGDAVAAESVTFAVPDGWQVEEGNCEFLDPTQEELPEGTEAGTALSIRIADTPFHEAADTEEIDGEIRWAGARSGYQAVRIRGDAAGQGIRPEGEPVQLVLVDLDAGTDDTGGTLVMSAGPSNGASFELAAQALDRIAQTVQVEAPAVEDPVVVTRHEGGGTPWAVTYGLDEGCFRLHRGGPTDDVADEACDLDPTGAEVVGTILSDGDLEVVVGYAPPLAVLVESDAATAPYGGITQPVEGASLFAYDAIRAPLDVRAQDATGEVVAEATIE